MILQCLLDKIAKDILSKKKTFTNGSLPASILQSCGVLKYRNCELIDTLLHAILYSSSPKRIEGLLAGLMTLSIVNYFPKYGTLILNVNSQGSFIVVLYNSPIWLHF